MLAVDVAPDLGDGGVHLGDVELCGVAQVNVPPGQHGLKYGLLAAGLGRDVLVGAGVVGGAAVVTALQLGGGLAGVGGELAALVQDSVAGSQGEVLLGYLADAFQLFLVAFVNLDCVQSVLS